jgi:hypothetical protein
MGLSSLTILRLDGRCVRSNRCLVATREASEDWVRGRGRGLERDTAVRTGICEAGELLSCS